jgi:hypothetical protein
MSRKEYQPKDPMAVPENGQFATELRDNKRQSFNQKQETQQKAHQRRQQIRELRDDDNWN